MTNIDIVFATVPYTDTKNPLMAPAILKSIATKANKTAITIDLNIEAVNFIETLPDKNNYIDFFHTGVSTSTAQISDKLFDLFFGFAKKLLEFNPKIIGLSVFTYTCQPATKFLSFIIKKLSPHTKIILGGAGLTNNLVGVSKFAEYLLQKKIIDFYIRGDGENSLYNYLTLDDTEIAGINGNAWTELTNSDLAQLPIPNYDDYDFTVYGENDTILMPILGSRGCVRNCSFCDIHAHWTKFSWRSGQHIFEEMIALSKKYDIHYFKFQDSLINGNLKEYRVLMKLISAHNATCPANKKLTWGSFFIIRPSNQFTEEDWRLTASGGAVYLAVGIETFSDVGRFHLGKKFTNADIEFSLQMAKKYNFQLALLFLVGYITETEADIDFAVKWYEEHTEYKDMILINLGTPLGILEGTSLKKNFDNLKLTKTGPNDQDWANEAIGNTPANRIKWFYRLKETVERLGYQQTFGSDNQYILERMMMQAVK